MAESPNFDSLDKEEKELIEKLERIKREKEELKKKKEVICHVSEFNPLNGNAGLKLSDFRDDIIDLLRRTPTRVFSNHYQINIVNEKYLDDFKFSFLELPNTKWEINEQVEAAIEKYRTEPDFSFGLDARKSNVVVKPSAKAYRINLYGIDTWSFHPNSNYYTFSIAELYKLPNLLESYFTSSRRTYVLSEDVKAILTGQLLRRKEIEEISNLKDAPEIESPFTEIDPKTGKKYELTADQRVAIKFDEAVGGRSIIAYDVGKGKTAIAIALAERQNLRVLFVCKANLKTNIKREIKKFTGKDAVVYSGVSPDKLSLAYMITQKTQYNIIGMEVIGRGKHEEDETHMPWVELINLSQFDRIFYDEAHLLKNMDSKRSKAARNLDNPTVDFFSGTPLVNRPKELYPMLNILDKSTFNNEASFINNFSDGKNGVKNLKALQEILKMYMIRRKNEDLDVKRITQTFELSSMARAIYNKALEGLYISLRKGTQTDINSILTQILRLKQIVAEDSVDFTVDLARETQDQTEKKVIIFSQFKDIHALVSRKLGSSCIVINGDVSSDDRRYELVDQFQDPNSEVKFLVTNIMEGLTLTEAWTTIFNDLWWTPKDHIQGEGRCFGRTNDYHGGVSYYVTADNTIIQMIEALLSEKMDTISKVVDDIHKETMMNGSVVQELIKKLMSGM